MTLGQRGEYPADVNSDTNATTAPCSIGLLSLQAGTYLAVAATHTQVMAIS
jgi:hypothetical protein